MASTDYPAHPTRGTVAFGADVEARQSSTSVVADKTKERLISTPGTSVSVFQLVNQQREFQDNAARRVPS